MTNTAKKSSKYPKNPGKSGNTQEQSVKFLKKSKKDGKLPDNYGKKSRKNHENPIFFVKIRKIFRKSVKSLEIPKSPKTSGINP